MTDGPRIRVAGLLINRGRVLLVRHEKEGRSYWLLPGGGVERGEQLDEALLRELDEECGFVPTALAGPIALAETIPPDDSPAGRHILHMIFAIDVPETGIESLVSADRAICGHAFVDQDALTELDLRPPIHAFLRDYRHGDAFVALGRMWVQ